MNKNNKKNHFYSPKNILKRLLFAIDTKKVLLIKQETGRYDVNISFTIKANNSFKEFDGTQIVIFEDCCQWDYIESIYIDKLNLSLTFKDIYKIISYHYAPPIDIIINTYKMCPNMIIDMFTDPLIMDMFKEEQ